MTCNRRPMENSHDTCKVMWPLVARFHEQRWNWDKLVRSVGTNCHRYYEGPKGTWWMGPEHSESGPQEAKRLCLNGDWIFWIANWILDDTCDLSIADSLHFFGFFMLFSFLSFVICLSGVTHGCGEVVRWMVVAIDKEFLALRPQPYSGAPVDAWWNSPVDKSMDGFLLDGSMRLKQASRQKHKQNRENTTQWSQTQLLSNGTLVLEFWRRCSSMSELNGLLRNWPSCPCRENLSQM